ncbi:uncharacterized protein LOC125507051 [Triticum urartu]|uniref:uncharacterized protein LOC125507051 n=1 Tax=Triticum urartu TaxID=4572 RepID=UPI0020437443|nr:uncharacterized protein LOC125507051 [Triticum urartu]
MPQTEPLNPTNKPQKSHPQPTPHDTHFLLHRSKPPPTLHLLPRRSRSITLHPGPLQCRVVPGAATVAPPQASAALPHQAPLTFYELHLLWAPPPCPLLPPTASAFPATTTASTTVSLPCAGSSSGRPPPTTTAQSRSRWGQPRLAADGRDPHCPRSISCLLRAPTSAIRHQWCSSHNCAILLLVRGSGVAGKQYGSGHPPLPTPMRWTTTTQQHRRWRHGHLNLVPAPHHGSRSIATSSTTKCCSPLFYFCNSHVKVSFCSACVLLGVSSNEDTDQSTLFSNAEKKEKPIIKNTQDSLSCVQFV